MNASTDWLDQLERNGFVFISNVFTPSEVESLRSDCAAALADPTAASSILVGDGDGPPHGARNLLSIWPAAVDLAWKPALADRLRLVLGEEAGLVRGLYFDKPAGTGWALPWHRDTTIAVQGFASFPVGTVIAVDQEEGVKVFKDGTELDVLPGSFLDEWFRKQRR